MWVNITKEVYKYTCNFIEGNESMGRKTKINEYQGFLPWYSPMVMSVTKNIDNIKQY